jgi:hypothetical protein
MMMLEKRREFIERTVRGWEDDPTPPDPKAEIIIELLAELKHLEARWNALPDVCPHENACRENAIENYEPEPPDRDEP